MSFIIFVCCVAVIIFILFAKKKTKQKPSKVCKTKRLTKQKSATPKKSTVDLPFPEQTALISPLPTKQKFTAINEWTGDLLLALEWKRFEEVCKEYLIMINQQAEMTTIGADGGIDIVIKNKKGKVIAIGQCKAWISKITVKEVREFFGVMASEKMTQGYYFATSTFTEDAVMFCADKNIILLDKHDLIKNINRLSKEKQAKLYQLATKGDYTTPTCPHCDKKMLKRAGKNSLPEFWGCVNYPTCRNTLQVRKVA